MSRFFNWHHTRLRGDKAAAKQYLGEGRKYLAYVDDHIRRGGKQQDFSFANADGVRFHVSMSGLVPILTIEAPFNVSEETFSCSLYMDTGLLEIGHETRDLPYPDYLPEFDTELDLETKPVLRQGETSACGGVSAHGAMTVIVRGDSVTFSSKCYDASTEILSTALADFYVGEAVLVTGTDKKNAQVRFPAGQWTGLMRRHIQALYGTPTAGYQHIELPGGRDVLRVYDETGANFYDYDCLHGRLIALVDVGRFNYRFVKVGIDSIDIIKPVYTDCGRALALALRRAKIGPTDLDKLETYLLSQIRAGHTEEDIEATLELKHGRNGAFQIYGHKFNKRGTRFAAIAGQSDNTLSATFVEYALDYDPVTDQFSVTVEQLEEFSARTIGTTAFVFPGTFASMAMHDPGPSEFAQPSLTDATNRATAVNAPMVCWYRPDDTLEVVRYFKSGVTVASSSAHSACAGSLAASHPSIFAGVETFQESTKYHSQSYDVQNISFGWSCPRAMISTVVTYFEHDPDAGDNAAAAAVSEEYGFSAAGSDVISGQFTKTGTDSRTDGWIPNKTLQLAQAYTGNDGPGGYMHPVQYAVDSSPHFPYFSDYVYQVPSYSPGDPNSGDVGGWHIEDFYDCRMYVVGTPHAGRLDGPPACVAGGTCGVDFATTYPGFGPTGAGPTSTMNITSTVNYSAEYFYVTDYYRYRQEARDEDGGAFLVMIPHGSATAVYLGRGVSRSSTYSDARRKIDGNTYYQTTRTIPTITGSWECTYYAAENENPENVITITEGGSNTLDCNIFYTEPGMEWSDYPVGSELSAPMNNFSMNTNHSSSYNTLDPSSGAPSMTFNETNSRSYVRDEVTVQLLCAEVDAPIDLGGLIGGSSGVSGTGGGFPLQTMTKVPDLLGSARTLGALTERAYVYRPTGPGTQTLNYLAEYWRYDDWAYLVNYNRRITVLTSAGGAVAYFNQVVPYDWLTPDTAFTHGYTAETQYISFIGWA